jgi:hypothetical protein
MYTDHRPFVPPIGSRGRGRGHRCCNRWVRWQYDDAQAKAQDVLDEAAEFVLDLLAGRLVPRGGTENPQPFILREADRSSVCGQPRCERGLAPPGNPHVSINRVSFTAASRAVLRDRGERRAARVKRLLRALAWRSATVLERQHEDASL